MEETCVVIKLLSGEEIVGLVSLDDMSMGNPDFLLKYPLRLVTMQSSPVSLSINLMKFMPYANTDIFTLNSEAVMLCEPAADDLVEYYQNVVEMYEKKDDEDFMAKRQAMHAARQEEMKELYRLMAGANTEPKVYH